jgi:hypothetical protein
MGSFAYVLENLATSITEKMETARFFELITDCPIIIQCNHLRLKEAKQKTCLGEYSWCSVFQMVSLLLRLN